MKVKVEEEQNSRPESGGDSPAKNIPTHPNSRSATPRSYPSKTNK